MASRPKRNRTYMNQPQPHDTDVEPQHYYESMNHDNAAYDGVVSAKRPAPIHTQIVQPQKSTAKKKRCRVPPWWEWIFLSLLLGVLAILIFMMVSDQGYGQENKLTYVSPKPGPGGRIKIADSIQQMMPPVLRGPNRAQSFCLPYKYKQPRNGEALAPFLKTFEQPPSVNTYTKCEKACEGPNRDHLLPSGDTCTSGTFDGVSGKCSLSAVDFDSSAHLIHQQDYRIDTFSPFGYCFTTLSPGCSRRVTKWHNRRPHLCLRTEHYLQPATLSDCIDGCYLLYLSSNKAMRCYGFTYGAQPQLCTFIVSPCSQPELELSPGTDFYSYGEGPGDSCSYCYDTYQPGTIGVAGYAGSSTGSYGYRDNDCAYGCNRYLQRYSTMCYGFDFNPSAERCHYMTTRDYTTVPKANTRNYRRHVTCYGCDRNTEYISTLDTPLSGPDEVPIATSTLSNCASRCDATKVNVTACYGFAYNSISEQCTIFRKFDQEVGNVGTMRGTDVFRRTFSCGYPHACQETYTMKTNSVSTGGIVQPKDINTVPRCEDRCFAYVIGTKQECYGFNFNRATSKCYIYTDPYYENRARNDANNNSYKRDKKCPLPY